MKSYDVSFQFETDCSVDINIISPEMSSAGTFFESRRATDKNKTLWIFTSNLSEELPIHMHVDYIISQLDDKMVAAINSIGKNQFLVVGVFYDTMTCSVLYASHLLSTITNVFPGISIKSICYPCQEE